MFISVGKKKERGDYFVWRILKMKNEKMKKVNSESQI